jgi:hypothetical protein
MGGSSLKVLPADEMVRAIIGLVVFAAITVSSACFIAVQAFDYATSIHTRGSVSRCETRVTKAGTDLEFCSVSFSTGQAGRQVAHIEQPWILQLHKGSRPVLWVTASGHERLGGWRPVVESVSLVALCIVLAFLARPGVALLREGLRPGR